MPKGVSIIMLDRMVAVTLGAIMIALGAYAINEPGVVRGYLKGNRLLSRMLSTDDRVRFLGVTLVLVAATWVVFVLAVPLAAAPIVGRG